MRLSIDYNLLIGFLEDRFEAGAAGSASAAVGSSAAAAFLVERVGRREVGPVAAEVGAARAGVLNGAAGSTPLKSS